MLASGSESRDCSCSYQQCALTVTLLIFLITLTETARHTTSTAHASQKRGREDGEVRNPSDDEEYTPPEAKRRKLDSNRTTVLMTPRQSNRAKANRASAERYLTANKANGKRRRSAGGVNTARLAGHSPASFAPDNYPFSFSYTFQLDYGPPSHPNSPMPTLTNQPSATSSSTIIKSECGPLGLSTHIASPDSSRTAFQPPQQKEKGRRLPLRDSGKQRRSTSVSTSLSETRQESWRDWSWQDGYRFQSRYE
jgi:hypothetical protein